MRAPYLGITGIVSVEDARAVGELLTAPPRAGYRYMVGFLVSLKTLRGKEVPNRRYPSIAQIPGLMEMWEEGVFRTLHYNTQDPDTLGDQLIELLERIPSAQGVQLNVRRPDREQIVRFRNRFPDKEVILQVNGSSLEERTPQEVLRYVGPYQGCVEHALLDLSGGTGHALDPEWVLQCIALGSSAWSQWKIRPGAAGGLGPDSFSVLQSLRNQCDALALPHLSFDAEGRLRIPVKDPIPGERYQDQLDPSRCKEYVDAGRRALSR